MTTDANPLLAEPMYLAGYIERLGTRTGDIIRLCEEKNLNEPEFIQKENFRTILWRTQKTGGEVTKKYVQNIDKEDYKVVDTLQATLQATLLLPSPPYKLTSPPDKLPCKLPDKLPCKLPCKLRKLQKL